MINAKRLNIILRYFLVFTLQAYALTASGQMLNDFSGDDDLEISGDIFSDFSDDIVGMETPKMSAFIGTVGSLALS